ncbi:MAG TPA: bifunctional 2-C-methyl-D-erythritol 4-phosphate cytidylyltransferase/2-C-methyl-D-erythritol 2,4-cyclodiphosphate synthase [Xanthobacteraceae bacterium]|nr:bifunctional 2-C-methyl-D-erythritol 4-phosphate cytidylyltransferase/2-C-methyl-D-erythritol 2,4-cyclodiphosphate synthase [Xanthobacteraceae bacterium]
MEFAALVVAGGGGTRAGAGKAKQYRLLAGEPVLRRSLRLFTDHREIGAVQAVIRPEDQPDYEALSADLPKCLPAVAGGATRQASVHAGLESLSAAAPRFVLVHDAARPFTGSSLIDRAIAAVRTNAAAIPAIAVTDTIKRVDAAGRIVANVERSELRAVQTPQAFRFDELLAAHRKAAAEGRSDFTDDAALMEWNGASVMTFEGSTQNTKLTTADDFARAGAAMASERGDVRTGMGYDVHAFAPGDHVTLGGIRIPYERALFGHSDADVLLHAMTDAILGAIGDGDIGHHFPPSDTQWRGADSSLFLKFAAERIRARGGIVAHLNGTLVCEAPKIGPHREAMRVRIAEICGIETGRVGVQATTNEGLGFIGRSEGIAAMAVATVRLPWSAA